MYELFTILVNFDGRTPPLFPPDWPRMGASFKIQIYQKIIYSMIIELTISWESENALFYSY